MSGVEPQLRQVSRYTLLDLIGSGGMGQVFQAKLSGPGRASKPVALKLIHRHLAPEQQFLQLFLEEVRIAMALTHRNIVQTFDGGEEDGRYYLVMELIRGRSLYQLLEDLGDAALPADLAIFIGMEICAALNYAHNYEPVHTGQPGGVLHLDISPSNILLSYDGDVKLTDFGVAKAAGSLVISSADQIRGKLRYMAPEQARGEEELRSDIYSLGAVLYELLTHRPIRQNAALESVQRGDLEIRLPSQLRPDVPSSLDRVLVRCLAADPDDRPRNAEALRKDLAAEALKLEPSGGGDEDLRGRLRAFLEYASDAPEALAEDPKASLLAEAIIDHAHAIPTDARAPATGKTTLPEGSPRRRDSRTPPLPTVSPPLLPTVSPHTPRRDWTFALVVALVFAGALAWLVDKSQQEEAAVGHSAATIAAQGDAVEMALDAAVAAVLRPDTTQIPGEGNERAKGTEGRVQTPAPGRLYLNAIPWARVYIDGKYTDTTPIQGLPLRPGWHSVRLVSPSSKVTKRLRVRIRSRQKLYKVINLQPQR